MGISLYPSLLNAAGPDAITSLLQQLTGAQMPPVQTTPSNNPAPELPKPVAAALPAASLLAPQAPAQPEHRSLLGRVVHNLASLPGAVANAAKEPIPPEYQAAVKAGLLSPQEVESARPGFLSSFAGTAAQHEGGAQGAYRESLGKILTVHQMAQQEAEDRRLAQVRSNMATMFQPKPGASLAEQRDLVTQAYLYAIRNGDLATAKTLEPTATESLKQSAAHGYEPQLFTSPDKSQLRYFSPSEATQIPDGWMPIQKPGSAGLGTPQIFRAPANVAAGLPKLVGIAPGDNETLQRYAALGYKPEVTARTEFVQGNLQDRFDVGRIDKGVKDYTSQIKPLRDRAAIIDQALVTLNDAAHNPNPAVRRTLYTTSVANFVQAADQKAQIRYQLLQYFKNNVDPSIGGRWEVLKSRLLNGTLPGYTLEAMLGHLQNLKRLTADEIEAQKTDYEKRRPELAGQLPETESFFPPTPNAPAAAAPPAGDLTQQRKDYDAAAAQLKKLGASATRITQEIGPRP